jgi:hypothetical protein
MSEAVNDTEYQERTINAVTERPEGWEIGSDGWVFWVPKEHGVTPHVGDISRFYGRGIGYRVRGLALNGHIAWYRSEEEDLREAQARQAASDAERRREFEQHGRAELDARYATLPPVFQRRIDRFRRNDPDFRWGSEGYEMSCAVDAVKIAAWARTPERVKEYHDLAWKEQQAAIPDIFQGHSGNSFAFACRLAHHYLTDPELVAQEHGALCILNGCDGDGKCYTPKGAA